MRTRIRATLCVLVTSLLASACDDPTAAEPVADLSIAPTPMMLAIGDSVQLRAQPVDANGRALDRPVRWRSSATGIASVSATGLLIALGSGEVTLTATSEDLSAGFVLEVVPVAATSIIIDANPINFLQGGIAPVEAIIRNARGEVLQGLPVGWTSRDTTIAAVDQAGNIRMVGPGVTYVLARYGVLKDSTHVTVRPLPVGAVR